MSTIAETTHRNPSSVKISERREENTVMEACIFAVFTIIAAVAFHYGYPSVGTAIVFGLALYAFIKFLRTYNLLAHRVNEVDQKISRQHLVDIEKK